MQALIIIGRSLRGLKDWMKGVHSEDGKPSFSRLAQGLIVYNTLAWVWYALIKSPTHTIPDLGGPALFVGGGAASHYGINQMKTWLGKGGNIPDQDSTLRNTSPAPPSV